MWGSACVDLREAMIDGPSVDIDAVAIMGGVTVLVPEGIPVEMDGCVVMGGTSNRTRSDSTLEGAPTVRVHACGCWGGVEVRTKRVTRAAEDEQTADDPIVPDQESVAPGPGVPSSDLDGGVRSSETSDRGSREESRSTPTDLPEGTLTIMFTDIVDSTSVVESMGDLRWSHALAEHDRDLRSIVNARGGTVVKGNGDGHLVVFPSARQAVLSGIEVRDASQVTLRVGLHTGEVVRQDGDVYGRNVIAASRIAESADPGGVMVSALTRDLVESAGDIAFGSARTVDLKGLSQPWTIYEASIDNSRTG